MEVCSGCNEGKVSVWRYVEAEMWNKVSAWEPRSGDVVDNPCRPQRSKGARGTPRTPPNVGAAERAMSSERNQRVNGISPGATEWRCRG